MYLHARILARNGQSTRASGSMASLLDEIHFIRHTLPGVLGAWYFERHQLVFNFYLDLLVTEADRTSPSTLFDVHHK